MMQMNISRKQTHRHREHTCGCQGEGEVGKGWTGSLQLEDANQYIEWINNKVPLCRTGNYNIFNILDKPQWKRI